MEYFGPHPVYCIQSNDLYPRTHFLDRQSKTPTNNDGNEQEIESFVLIYFWNNWELKRKSSVLKKGNYEVNVKSTCKPVIVINSKGIQKN